MGPPRVTTPSPHPPSKLLIHLVSILEHLLCARHCGKHQEYKSTNTLLFREIHKMMRERSGRKTDKLGDKFNILPSEQQ